MLKQFIINSERRWSYECSDSTWKCFTKLPKKRTELIVKPKSSPKSKSQIHRSQIQNPKSKGKGMGLGLTI